MARIWGEWLDGPEASMRFHKIPSLSRNPRNSRLTPSPIIYNILIRKGQEMSQLFSNNIASFNTTNNINLTVTDDQPNILAWLSPLDPKFRHQDIRDRRVEGIGEWLLQTEEFKSWCAGSGRSEVNDAVLFCYGDPGVRKTYIR